MTRWNNASPLAPAIHHPCHQAGLANTAPHPPTTPAIGADVRPLQTNKYMYDARNTLGHPELSGCPDCQRPPTKLNQQAPTNWATNCDRPTASWAESGTYVA